MNILSCTKEYFFKSQVVRVLFQIANKYTLCNSKYSCYLNCAKKCNLNLFFFNFEPEIITKI